MKKPVKATTHYLHQPVGINKTMFIAIYLKIEVNCYGYYLLQLAYTFDLAELKSLD